MIQKQKLKECWMPKSWLGMPSQLLPTSGRAQIPGFLNPRGQLFQEQGYLLLHLQNNFHFDRAKQPSVHLCLLWNPGMSSESPGSRNFGEAEGSKCWGPARRRRKGHLDLFFPEPEEGFCGTWGLEWTQDWRGSPHSQKVLCVFGSFFRILTKSVQNW